MIRVAAVGDLHCGAACPADLGAHFATLHERADLLLLAGDFTQHGLVEEIDAFIDALPVACLPIVAVLGNHEYNLGNEERFARRLEAAGVRVLELSSTVIQVGGVRIGVAGAKGFCGGFGGSSGAEFGEREMKQFIHASKVAAEAIGAHLARLQCDLRIALTHYAPARDTLLGEKLELYPFLGSYLLGEAIDRAGCDLAVHGHAHHGTERGLTAGGVPVRNVAMPVIKAAFNVYEFATA